VNGNAANALFDAPAHVLPSMTALYRSFMDTMLPKPNAQVVDGTVADEDDNSANPQSKRQKKKSNKKRKKLANATSEGDNFVNTDDSKDDDKQKRMKLLVEKELANPALQQQTYSKLLAAFRKTKQ
jgi:hypothetical protein